MQTYTLATTEEDLQLSNFYTWGGGGEIIKIKIEAV
jgi:hypothetical protein